MISNELARKKKTPKRAPLFANRPLAALAKVKLAEAEETSPTASKTSAAPDPKEPEEEDDGRLFFSAMGGVAPLPAHRDDLPPFPPVTLARPIQERENEEVQQALRDLVEGGAPLSIHETVEAIEGAVDGLDPRVLKKLRAGEFSVQDHLDLHGCTKQEAHQKVETFLANATAQGKRCVLIIHGRGHGSKDHEPVLKNALRTWFTRGGVSRRVLAFTTARPCDGGAGAIYVLLRRHRSR